MKIIVMGVGKAGNTIVENVLEKEKYNNVNFIYADTNKKLLEKFDKNSTLFLNSEIGDLKVSNNDPLISKYAVTNSIDDIKEKLINSKILILTSGFGGLTGTYALPLIAKIAKDMGIITVAIISTPFSYEGTSKEKNAQEGLKELKEIVDTLIVVSNNKLINNYPDIAALDAIKLTNNFSKNCIKTFLNFISDKSIINISTNDLISLLKNKGESYIGFGNGLGKNKIIRAVNKTFESKIIDKTITNSTHIALNIIGDPTVTMKEINEIIELFKSNLKQDNLKIFFSFDVNKEFVNEIQLSVIATFEKENKNDSTFEQKPNIKIIDNKNESIQNSQEILINIGNTLENELSGYLTGELELNNLNIDIDDKDQEDFIISIDESEEDDDIPFFLK